MKTFKSCRSARPQELSNLHLRHNHLSYCIVGLDLYLYCFKLGSSHKNTNQSFNIHINIAI